MYYKKNYGLLVKLIEKGFSVRDWGYRVSKVFPAKNPSVIYTVDHRKAIISIKNNKW